MARQYMKVVGVGGGRGGRVILKRPRAGRAPRVYRTTEQILAKAAKKDEQREI
jgi:hypothetical protein